MPLNLRPARTGLQAAQGTADALLDSRVTSMTRRHRPIRETFCSDTAGIWRARAVVAIAVGAVTIAAASVALAPSAINAQLATATAAPAVAPGVRPESGPLAVTRTAKETAHFKAFDAAVADVRATEVSAEDAAQLKLVAKSLAANDVSAATEARGRIGNAIAGKLADWMRLRSGYAQAAEYPPFLSQNPAWPDRATLQARFEEAVFAQGGSAATIKSLLATPRTGVGHAALASAELALGDQKAATARAARAWRDMVIPATFEVPFLERFGALLTPADHKWRLDRLMMDDIRWAPERAERSAVIRRQIDRLPEADRKRAIARLAVFEKRDGAKPLIVAALKDAPKDDWGFLYHRIQLLRRADKIDDAVKLMASAPIDPKVTPNLDDWWGERRGLAYAALNDGKPKVAYDLVKAAGPLTVNPAKEQAFMAGWLAMRFLNDYRAAKQHFLDAEKVADGPLSRAKAGYWLGRVAEAGGDVSTAAGHYRTAVKEVDTFYGQLAKLRLDPKDRQIEIKLPAAPTAEQVARFNGLDAVKAAVIARKAGLDIGLQRAFWNHLRTFLDTEAEGALANHLAVVLGDVQTAVRNAKSSVARGQNMLVYAYPLHTFPTFEPLGATTPELAMLLAIARQESEFNTETVSGAGAKGLLQVMTITAQHVCKDYKIKPCPVDKLLADPVTNARFAGAYVGDRMAEFRGSYVLALAGYNAGPGRARQWIREFGDPRDPKVDPLDWIERIPFQETREYVGKVLSNIQIYRARMGNEGRALQLDVDLNRGRGGALPVPGAGPAPAPGQAPAAVPRATSNTG